MNADTKPCRVCGKQMVRKYALYVLTSYPPQRPWTWWCGCGHTEEGGVERGRTYQDEVRAEWERVNSQDAPR